MKKNIFRFLISLLVVVFVYSFALASVGVKSSGSSIGAATDINFSTGLDASSDGSTVTVTPSGSQTITGGTINGAVIGGSTPAAVTGTTVTSTGAMTAGTGLTATTGGITASAGAVTGTSLSAGSGTVTFKTNLLTIGYANGGVSTVVTGSTTLPLTYGTIKLVGGGQACTLANGTAGQLLNIIVVDYVGATTVTPATSTGLKSASFGADGHCLTLQYVDDTRGWVVVGYNGTTLTLKNSGL
jgi:hypothetical protein